MLATALLLAACGRAPTPSVLPSQENPTNISATTPTSTSKSPSATPEKVTTPGAALAVNPGGLQGLKLRFWHVWSGEAGAVLEELVEAFNAENEYGIQVATSRLANYNDLYGKVEAALAADDPPHVAVGYNYQLLIWAQASDAVLDLAPYVSDSQWGLEESEQADFYPTFWEQELAGGFRFGMPALRFAEVMAYNLSWAEELGFSSPPGTTAEFQRQACAAAQANNADDDPENNGTGGWAINTGPATTISWLYAFGSQAVQPGGRGYQFNTPESAAAIAYLMDLSAGGCAWQPSSDYAEGEFAGRQALFITVSTADLPFIKAAMDSGEYQDEWALLAFPSAAREKTLDVFGPALAVFRSTPEEQLASWLLVKWLLAPPNQARWAAATSALPTRTSTLALMEDYAAANPQWAQAALLLPHAKPEPAFASWSVVRWAVGDVGTQTFRFYFTSERIEAMLDLLDETAAELHARFR